MAEKLPNTGIVEKPAELPPEPTIPTSSTTDRDLVKRGIWAVDNAWSLTYAGTPGVANAICPSVICTTNFAVYVYQLYAYARTAPGAGGASFRVKLNGTSIGTVTIANGATTGTLAVTSTTRVGINDRLDLDCTANNGAADITVVVRPAYYVV